MAWVSKDVIDIKKPQIKALNKKFGVKATLSGTNSHTMKITVWSGSIDFIQNYIDTINKNNYIPDVDKKTSIKNAVSKGHINVNTYYLDIGFSADALRYLEEAKQIMTEGNYNRSDIQSDYFDIGWYINIDIGRWNKPYELIAQ